MRPCGAIRARKSHKDCAADKLNLGIWRESINNAIVFPNNEIILCKCAKCDMRNWKLEIGNWKLEMLQPGS